jgi:hypothetical protein
LIFPQTPLPLPPKGNKYNKIKTPPNVLERVRVKNKKKDRRMTFTFLLYHPNLPSFFS